MANPEFTTEELATEIWLPVKGYENVYAVSNLGRVKRLANSSNGPGKAGMIIKSRTASNGYELIGLCHKSKKSYFTVHKLVALAFLGEKPADNFQVDHLNGNKADNRAGNLEYVSELENHRRASTLGLKASGDRHGSRKIPESRPRGVNHAARKNPQLMARGEKNGNSRYSLEQILKVKELLSSRKYKHKEIALITGVSKSTVDSVSRGCTWKDV